MADPWFKVGDHVRGRRVSDVHDFSSDPYKRGVVIAVHSSRPSTVIIQGTRVDEYNFTITLDNDQHSLHWYQWCFELDTPLSSFDAAVRAYISRELNDTP